MGITKALRIVIVLLPVAVVSACPGNPCQSSTCSTPDGGDGGPDGGDGGKRTPEGGDGGRGPPPQCNAQGDPDAAGFCTLAESTPLLMGICDPSAVVQDGEAFVLGGLSVSGGNETTASVQSALLSADGGALEQVGFNTALPSARGEAAVAAANGFIFVIGGAVMPSAGSSPLSTVDIFRVNPDGGSLTLLETDGGADLPDGGNEGGAAVTSNGFLYLLGGEGPHDLVNGPDANATGPVLFAQIHPDGTLGAWASTTPLPGGRFHHGAAASNGHIYVVGGKYPDSDSFCEPDKILVAQQNADGTLGNWLRATTEFQVDLNFPGVALVNNTLVVAGGTTHFDVNLTGNPYFYAAAVNADGSLGPWQTIAEYMTPANERALAAGLNAIYSFGGNPASGAGCLTNTEQLDVLGPNDFSCPP